MTAFGYLLFLTFPALLVFAAIFDLLTMTIPNRISLALAAAFVPAALAGGMEPVLVAWHALAGLGILCVCFGLFALNWIGGGDAKLAAAIALWIGPYMLLLEWLILAAILGGVLTLALLGVRLMPLPRPLAKQDWIARLHDTKTGVPYGIALASAGLATYPSTDIFARLAI